MTVIERTTIPTRIRTKERLLFCSLVIHVHNMTYMYHQCFVKFAGQCSEIDKFSCSLSHFKLGWLKISWSKLGRPLALPREKGVSVFSCFP